MHILTLTEYTKANQQVRNTYTVHFLFSLLQSTISECKLLLRIHPNTNSNRVCKANWQPTKVYTVHFPFPFSQSAIVAWNFLLRMHPTDLGGVGMEGWAPPLQPHPNDACTLACILTALATPCSVFLSTKDNRSEIVMFFISLNVIFTRNFHRPSIEEHVIKWH